MPVIRVRRGRLLPEHPGEPHHRDARPDQNIWNLLMITVPLICR
jgi:hypothetical protein